MGRKPQYDEPTKTKSYRFPISKEKELDKAVKELQDKWRTDKKWTAKDLNPKDLNHNECDCYLDGKIMKRGKSGCRKSKKDHNFT